MLHLRKHDIIKLLIHAYSQHSPGSCSTTSVRHANTDLANSCVAFANRNDVNQAPPCLPHHKVASRSTSKFASHLYSRVR